MFVTISQVFINTTYYFFLTDFDFFKVSQKLKLGNSEDELPFFIQ